MPEIDKAPSFDSTNVQRSNLPAPPLHAKLTHSAPTRKGRSNRAALTVSILPDISGYSTTQIAPVAVSPENCDE